MRTIVCVFCWVMTAGVLAFAQPSEPAPAAPAGIDVPLLYQPDAFSKEDYNFENMDFAFKKEPEYAGPRVYRGALPDGTGFAVDLKAGRLYLDTNRSHDLTDDPDNVYEGDPQLLLFENVRLPRTEGPGQEPVAVNVHFTDGASFFITTVKSGWRGQVELGGRKFDIGVPDTISGEAFGGAIDVTPADGENPPTLTMGPRGWLAVGDHAYSVQIEVKDASATAILRETDKETGEIVLDAYALELTQDPDPDSFAADSMSVVFPDKKFRLPVGHYAIDQIHVRSGAITYSATPRQGRLSVETATVSPKFGPPLKEQVTAERIGSRLKCVYQLVGQGNEVYCAADPTVNAPTILVKQGERELFADKFDTEYG